MNYFAIMIFFSFLSCSCQNKLETAPIYTNWSREVSYNSTNGDAIYSTKNVLITPRLPTGITVFSITSNTLKYQMHGAIGWGGHSIQKVRRIRTEQEQKGDTLLVKHYVEIKRIPGKESANIRGYNFTKNETIRLSDTVKIVSIELYKEFLFTAEQQREVELQPYAAQKLIKISEFEMK